MVHLLKRSCFYSIIEALITLVKPRQQRPKKILETIAGAEKEIAKILEEIKKEI